MLQKVLGIELEGLGLPLLFFFFFSFPPKANSKKQGPTQRPGRLIMTIGKAITHGLAPRRWVGRLLELWKYALIMK